MHVLKLNRYSREHYIHLSSTFTTGTYNCFLHYFQIIQQLVQSIIAGNFVPEVHLPVRDALFLPAIFSANHPISSLLLLVPGLPPPAPSPSPPCTSGCPPGLSPPVPPPPPPPALGAPRDAAGKQTAANLAFAERPLRERKTC